MREFPSYSHAEAVLSEPCGRRGVRVLYIDINGTFLNPTRGLVFPTIAKAASANVFGPGFVDSETLRRGLRAFIESIGAVDVAIANSHTLFADIYVERPLPGVFGRSYVLDFPRADVIKLPEIAADFEHLGELGIRRVALLLESDYYNWTSKEIDALDRRVDYAIGFGPEFFREKADLPNLSKESFAGHSTDEWARWVGKRADRVASLTHFVSDTEFRWDRLAYRKHLWAIPGIQYHARKTARATLARHGVGVLGESPLRRGIGVAKKLGLIRRESRLLQQYLNLDHQARLASSRYVYTCGSGLNMPVRKFFEIPAAGAVLVCQPFNGFEAAGFRDQENAIVCQPEKIMDAHHALEADPQWAQRIADAGRRLVFDRHSAAARGAQLAETLSAMADGSFAGGRWVEGEYIVKRRTG